MSLWTLLSFSFTLLSIISTVLAESGTELVLDWEGKPVEGGSLYELWIVGYHTGAIGAGSFTDESLGYQFVIDRHWDCNITYDGNLTVIMPKGFKRENPVVPVATDCSIGFVSTMWKINRKVGSFITTNGNGTLPDNDSLFQFLRVNGTENNPYLYKLITIRDNVPVDIVSINNSAGERSLYLNQNKSVPDTWGTRISFVKGKVKRQFS